MVGPHVWRRAAKWVRAKLSFMTLNSAEFDHVTHGMPQVQDVAAIGTRIFRL
jgi:hypothetical protein